MVKQRHLVVRSLLAGLVLWWLSGCSSTPSVVTDYDTAFSFGELESFRVEATERDDPNSLLISPFTLMHLQRLIEQQLQDRYELVQEASDEEQEASGETTADFLVRYHIVTEDRLDVRNHDPRFGFGLYGYGPWYRYSYTPGPQARVYRQGTLVIDVVRARDEQPLWRGVSEQRLADSLTPQERRERLSAAATEILSRFPPES